MKRFLLLNVLFACSFSLASIISNAQSFEKRTDHLNFIRGTAGTGLSSYYGDLCDNFECFRFRPQFSIGGYYRFNENFSFKAEFNYMRFFSTDKGGTNKKRNLSFRSGNAGFMAGVVYDLFKYERFYHKRKSFTPYIFAGAAALFFNPRAKASDGKWHSLQPLQTEGKKYSRFTFGIPFGGGIRLKQTPVLDMSFEVSYTKTFTDYIDDISTAFVDNTSFEDPLAAELADRTNEGGFPINTNPNDPTHWEEDHKRGNPKRKDGYLIFGFKVEYLLVNMKEQRSKMHKHKMPKFKKANLPKPAKIKRKKGGFL
ncbi:MAG: outer membrane beta-barrel protein [Cytophagales bacterium]|nr:outer membrane beta-barrel protein [Cytophagales bacterium]